MNSGDEWLIGKGSMVRGQNGGLFVISSIAARGPGGTTTYGLTKIPPGMHASDLDLLFEAAPDVDDNGTAFRLLVTPAELKMDTTQLRTARRKAIARGER